MAKMSWTAEPEQLKQTTDPETNKNVDRDIKIHLFLDNNYGI